MRRLRVLIAALILAGCGEPPPPPEPELPPTSEIAVPAPVAPAPAPAKKPDGERPVMLKTGEQVDALGPYPQLLPDGPAVTFGASGKPTILFYWSPTTRLAREELVRFDAWVAETQLRKQADVYAIAGTRETGWSGLDVRDIALILGIKEVPVIADEEFALANLLGVQNSPEIVAVGSDGKFLAKLIRSLDHGRLQPTDRPGPMDARAYLLDVAKTGTGPVLPRTFPYNPADALIGHLVPDLSLPEFSVDGAGKGKMRSLRSLMTGKRPAVILFFSSTCSHCQVDIPQIVKLQKENPGAWDIIGITGIKNDKHRAITAQYLKHEGITFPVLEDVGSVNDAFMITGTPTDVYIAANGTIGELSYYQHQDLAKDWGLVAERLKSVAKGKDLPKNNRGWAFPLKLKDEKGAEVDLASFKGSPTILHFWATWCQPCLIELPKLLEAMPQLEANGKVALITVEKDAAVMDRYRKKTGFDIQSYLDPHDGLADKLNFGRSVPRTYVLDANGNIRSVMQGSYAWEDPQKLARVIDQLR